MKQRCFNKKANSYHAYGAKGISVCNEWKNSFKSFYDWATNNGYADELSIDRYPNGQGNYEPDNCRWATNSEQHRNMSTNKILAIFGEEKTMVDWSEDSRCTVEYKTLKGRILSGWDSEEAMTAPSGGPIYNGNCVVCEKSFSTNIKRRIYCSDGTCGSKAWHLKNPYVPGPDRREDCIMRGSSNGSSKLTEEDVKTIRNIIVRGTRTKAQLAREYEVSDTTIGSIISRKLWKHVSDNPKIEK